MNNRYFPKYDITTLIQIMWNARLNWTKTKANKYRYKYLKQLCKSIIKDLEEEKDHDNVIIFKELLKDIKHYNYKKHDGRIFRDIKYNYYYLDELYKLGVFKPLEVNENA